MSPALASVSVDGYLRCRARGLASEESTPVSSASPFSRCPTAVTVTGVLALEPEAGSGSF